MANRSSILLVLYKSLFILGCLMYLVNTTPSQWIHLGGLLQIAIEIFTLTQVYLLYHCIQKCLKT